MNITGTEFPTLVSVAPGQEIILRRMMAELPHYGEGSFYTGGNWLAVTCDVELAKAIAILCEGFDVKVWRK